MLETSDLTAQVKAYALDAGADFCGVAPVETYDDYRAQIRERMAETESVYSDFMVAPEDAALFERLTTATNTLPSAKAILILGVNAYDHVAVYARSRGQRRAKIARTYSHYPVVREAAANVTAWLQDRGYQAVHGQHVPLKLVAHRIGLGAYGKNGVLLTKRFGSFIGLRNVITDAPLAPDALERPSFCEDCDLCLRACPTGALYAPYKVNPRLCLNPISRREDEIAPETRAVMQNWLQGCDICQEVCPANRGLVPRETHPRAGFEPQYHASHSLLGGVDRFPLLLELLGSDNPMIIRRNAAIALGNVGRGDPEVVAALQARLDEESGQVREAILWALDRLDAPVGRASP